MCEMPWPSRRTSTERVRPAARSVSDDWAPSGAPNSAPAPRRRMIQVDARMPRIYLRIGIAVRGGTRGASFRKGWRAAVGGYTIASSDRRRSSSLRPPELSMSDEDMRAELERLRKENESLKK